MISLLEFYEVMRHSPLDTFIIQHESDASFTIMRGETLGTCADKYKCAYVVDVIPEAVYNYNSFGDDDFSESLRVIAKLP